MRDVTKVLCTVAASASLVACASALGKPAATNLSPSPAAPRACGYSRSGTYAIRVNAGTPCAFGRSTYRAFARAVSGADSALNAKLGQEAGAAFNFTLRVGRTTLDCRANGLAHDQFDIACNDVNRYGTRIVDLLNATEPAG